MKIITVALVSLFVFAACKSKNSNNTHNQNYSEIYHSSTPTSPTEVPNSAMINGNVYLQALPAVPLVNAKINLQNQNGKTLAVTTSSVNGKFIFQRKLEKGHYKIVIKHPKYHGSLPIDYENKNIENLQFFVDQVEKQKQ